MKLPVYEDAEMESLFTTEVILLPDNTGLKICELLGLNPDDINAILVESDGSFEGVNMIETVTIKRVKRS